MSWVGPDGTLAARSRQTTALPLQLSKSQTVFGTPRKDRNARFWRKASASGECRHVGDQGISGHADRTSKARD